MERIKFSLKWLEVFQAVARSGSVRDAAQHLDLSISTVSHHLKCLEQELGVALIEHDKRPMRLTAAGKTLSLRVDESLNALQAGLNEIWSDDAIGSVRMLNIAMVEEFDPLVQPHLAQYLHAELPQCALSFHSRASDEILKSIKDSDVDIGIATVPDVTTIQLDEREFLRDPFIVVAPKNAGLNPSEYLKGSVDLPFATYSAKQLIGQRIEAQLRRKRMNIQSRICFESTAAILGMVASGKAWTITTALAATCINDMMSEVDLMPLPDAAFARKISLFYRSDFPDELLDLFEVELRNLVQERILDTAVENMPWLKEGFRLLG